MLLLLHCLVLSLPYAALEMGLRASSTLGVTSPTVHTQPHLLVLDGRNTSAEGWWGQQVLRHKDSNKGMATHGSSLTS